MRGPGGMQTFAEWLTASRARALAGAVLLALAARILMPFGLWVLGALVVLLALRRAPAPDSLAALVGGLVLGWFLLALGAGPVPALLIAAAAVVPPLALGRLLARGSSLNLAFQLAVVAALAFLAAVYVVLADPPGVWRPVVERAAAELDRMGAFMSASGLAGEDAEARFIETSALRMWGVVAWLLLLNSMVAAFVGLHWSGLVEKRPRLGPAFRQLKAGRTLAVAALAAVVATVAFRSNLAADAALVLLGAFLLQGLAVLHSARDSLGLGTGWLAATYVLLFLPYTTAVVMLLLAAAGFADNWLSLRERFAAARRERGP